MNHYYYYTYSTITINLNVSTMQQKVHELMELIYLQSNSILTAPCIVTVQ
jgi:hypothetical protein